MLVGDYLQSYPTDTFLELADGYRKYPIIYVPVNDPRNPANIKGKFENDFEYESIQGSPKRYGFSYSYVRIKQPENRSIVEINCTADEMSLILCIKNA